MSSSKFLLGGVVIVFEPGVLNDTVGLCHVYARPEKQAELKTVHKESGTEDDFMTWFSEYIGAVFEMDVRVLGMDTPSLSQ